MCTIWLEYAKYEHQYSYVVYEDPPFDTSNMNTHPILYVQYVKKYAKYTHTPILYLKYLRICISKRALPQR